MLHDTFFLKGLLIFILLNSLLYLFIIQFHNLVPFNRFNYQFNAHHYIPDNIILNKPFFLPNALSQFDAQWYLKIAESGYPAHPQKQTIDQKEYQDSLTYAFFPLYPIIIGALNVFINNIEVSAFILSQTLMILNFGSLYFVITKIYDQKTALKTCFLLFLFPFSIFYRSYFPESLLLLMIIWVGYFWIKQKLWIVALLIGLLNITKANIYLLDPVFIISAIKYFWGKKNRFKNIWFILFLVSVPSCFWMIFNYQQTDDLLFFVKVRDAWNVAGNVPFFIYNFYLMTLYPILPLHAFHSSKIDIFFFIIVIFLLVKSYGKINKYFWWIGLCVGIGPFFVTDFMSYTRYQIINFPIFLFLSLVFNRYLYFLITTLFLFSLFYISLYFVNWRWIG